MNCIFCNATYTKKKYLKNHQDKCDVLVNLFQNLTISEKKTTQELVDPLDPQQVSDVRFHGLRKVS